MDVPRKGNVDRNNTMCPLFRNFGRTFPARGTWIEIHPRSYRRRGQATFPARGTWIEIYSPGLNSYTRRDVPRKGNVDRNPKRLVCNQPRVDVPRKGNVDRNNKAVTFAALGNTTFPARGTWIEMASSRRRSRSYS